MDAFAYFSYFILYIACFNYDWIYYHSRQVNHRIGIEIDNLIGCYINVYVEYLCLTRSRVKWCNHIYKYAKYMTTKYYYFHKRYLLKIGNLFCIYLFHLLRDEASLHLLKFIYWSTMSTLIYINVNRKVYICAN